MKPRRESLGEWIRLLVPKESRVGSGDRIRQRGCLAKPQECSATGYVADDSTDEQESQKCARFHINLYKIQLGNTVAPEP